MPNNFEAHVKAGVQGRTRVVQLLATDGDAARRVAQSIEHPWYRCQALSAVAERITDTDRATSLLGDALKSADELEEPNRIVTAASWPLRVLVNRRLGDPARETDRLLKVIAAEPHTLRRAQALFSLLEATFADASLRDRALPALMASLSASRGWRSERLWAFTSLLMAGESGESAYRVYHEMPESRAKRRLARQLVSPEYVGPRWIQFFQG